jgi:GAF domain-containing protein
MDEPTEALEHRLLELTGIVLADATLEAALGHVARVTVRAIPACDAAGLSVLEHGRITTAAASVPLVHRLDAHQSAVEEGPCLEAIRTGEVRRSPRLRLDARWPRFRRLAVGEGVVSCLSLPIGTGDLGMSGALNLYSRDRPFEQTDEDIGRRYVTSASVVVANAHAYARTREVIEQLEEALQSRDAIGRAKGIIQSRAGCSPDEAFDQLRVMSQHRNVKLRDLAEAVVESRDDLVHG